ncbi:hypothetical protein niasHS_002558 [Heterodera schachtii]|uniref:Metalloendopeptidase n=1 Tax=Heterodera schachtii TaxID=97005 RepID=A0ABD2KKA5_HETSC
MFRQFRWVKSVLCRLSFVPPIPRLLFLSIFISFSSFCCPTALLDERIYTINREEYEKIAEHFLLPEDFDLAEKTPTQKPTLKDLDSILNYELFEGDILGMTAPPTTKADQNSQTIGNLRQMSVADEGRQRTKGDFDRIFSQPYYSSLNTQTYPNKLWHEGRVPYMLEEGMSALQRAAIASAFDEYKGKTCIRFVPRQSTESDFIYVRRNFGLGCSSYVGRAGGNQTVSLEVDKCFSKGIIAHELMHALGFFHEHSRTDRDEYVDLLEDNVRPGMLRNFEKYPKKIIDPLGMPYDYGSVMHYHKLAFSRNGRATIVPKSKSVEIGQRHKLSEIDAMKVNKLYRCDSEGPATETTTTAPKRTSETTTETKTTQTEEQTTTEESEPTTGEEETTEQTEETTTDDGAETETTTEETERGTTEETAATTETETEPEKTTTHLAFRNKTKPKERRTKWPNVAKKFITLSIWSTRGERRHNKGNGTPKGGRTRGLSKISGRERCVDLNAHCEMWERLGHCVHSAKYMRHYCRKSCGFCDEKERERTDQLQSCIDRNHFCTYWAQNGECEKGSKFMKLFCKRSCKIC